MTENVVNNAAQDILSKIMYFYHLFASVWYNVTKKHRFLLMVRLDSNLANIYTLISLECSLVVQSLHRLKLK